MRLNVGLLDSLLERQPINLHYVILRHMLSTLGVNNQLLPYGSVITKILQHFHVPIRASIYVETKRIGDDAITGTGFYRKSREWVKIPLSKNRDTLVALDNDRMLNDICSPDQLSNFRLGARPPPPRRGSMLQNPADSDFEKYKMDTDQPPALEDPTAPNGLILSLSRQQLQTQFVVFKLQHQQILYQ